MLNILILRATLVVALFSISSASLSVDPTPEFNGRIIGNTDNTKIGNTGDRINVQTQEPLPVNITEDDAATDERQPICRFLDNGSNISMDVNGSSTAQIFDKGPSGTDIWLIDTIRLMLQDDSLKVGNNFGDVSGLSNGLLIESTLNSTTIEIMNPKNNYQLATLFTVVYSQPGGNQLASGNPVASLDFKIIRPIILKASRTDLIKATVRDNLTGLFELHIVICGWQLR